MSTSKDSPLYTAYKRYMRSDEGKEVREMVLKRDHHHCMLCHRAETDSVNGNPVSLTVHHNDYRFLGNEKNHLDCLITLCSGCHKYGGHRNANGKMLKMPVESEGTPELKAFIEKGQGTVKKLSSGPPKGCVQAKHRSCYRCDLEGNILQEYHYIQDAVKEYGQSIMGCLRGRGKTAYGFKGKYKDEVDR